jgi:hypothetical protein
MRVLVISDTQIPFHHKDYLAFLKAVARKYKTNEVVHIGDEVDMHALGQWEHDPDGYSAGDETRVAVKELKKLYKAFPRAKVCHSNHTSRALRKGYSAGIPAGFFKHISEVLEAPKGWVWDESFIIDGVKYQHGVGYSGPLGAKKASLDNARSTVIGHLHSHAGIQYSATPEYLVFGMNVGSLIDNDTYAFAYGRTFSAKPIISCGLVLDGMPLLVAMALNKRGRWTGKL